MQPVPNSQELQTLIVSFVRAFGLHNPEMTPCGQPISVSEAHALMELEQERGIRQQVLADRLNLEKSTVSRLVKKLENRGWIERTTDPADTRAFLLRLTEAGRKNGQRIQQARTETFENLLESLDPGIYDAVTIGLSALVDALRINPGRRSEK